MPIIAPTVEVRVCPCCGRADAASFDSYTHHGVRLEYRICRACGTVFLSPRFSDTALLAFYESEYRTLYGGEPGPTRANLIVQRARAEHLSRLVREYVGPVESHLDIGCSTGELLVSVRDSNSAPRCESVGIEPSVEHAAWSERRDLTVFPSLESMIDTWPRRFDLVSLSHVLEHLVEPWRTLRTIREKVLDTRGHLLIEVPNLLGHPSFEIAHLTCFTRWTLGIVLRRAGFTTRFVKVHGVANGSAGLRAYLTVLATPSLDGSSEALETSTIPWRAVKPLRTLGLLGFRGQRLANRIGKAWRRRAAKFGLVRR